MGWNVIDALSPENPRMGKHQRASPQAEDYSEWIENIKSGSAKQVHLKEEIIITIEGSSAPAVNCANLDMETDVGNNYPVPRKQ
jgi:hypothetical protein